MRVLWWWFYPLAIAPHENTNQLFQLMIYSL